VQKGSSYCLPALIALVCAWPLVGCGGSDGSGSEPSKAVASAGQQRSDADPEAGGTTNRRSGEGSASQRSGDATDSGTAPPPGPAAGSPGAAGAASEGQTPSEALQHPKQPHKSTKSHSGDKSGGGATAGLSPQEAAAYETARALCANPDSLQYAPEEIRDDAEALAKFAERFAPPGEEQIVHDGCLVGLKSIGIG
jgi:hypothetical protein